MGRVEEFHENPTEMIAIVNIFNGEQTGRIFCTISYARDKIVITWGNPRKSFS